MEKIRQLFQRRWFKVLALLALALYLIFTIRSCASSKSDHRVYKVARDQSWYPLNFLGKEKNVLGFSDDLLYAIAKKNNLSFQLIAASPGSILDDLEDIGVDAVLSSLTPDPILRKKYLFSDPYYNLGLVLVVPENSTVASLKDLAGKYLGIQRGTSIPLDLSSIRIISYESNVAMMEDLVKDQIDAVLINQLNAYSFTTGYYKGRLKVATNPLTPQSLKVVTYQSKKNQKLIDLFNQGLKELKESGVYDELLKKWDLYDPYVD